MQTLYYTFSCQGRCNVNQDTVFTFSVKSAFLGIVCGGMGGYHHGDIASLKVASALRDYWLVHDDLPNDHSKVHAACRKARIAINEAAIDNGYASLGTTMVLACITDNHACIANAGNSRCYVVSPQNGLIYQTTDHLDNSSGTELVSKGFVSFHPELAVPDVINLELQPGTRLLLCSDGVHKCFTDDSIVKMLRKFANLQVLLTNIQSYCKMHNNDNYSAILVEV
ncbi:MAG: PP2C family protein-serine/threonine phosphatase [Muribaculaceae bacterium]